MAVTAVKSDRTLAQLAEQLEVHPKSDRGVEAQLESGRLDALGPGDGNAAALPAIDVKSLHAKIVELTVEKDS